MNLNNKIEVFSDAKKPEKIMFYNSTKRGIDMEDIIMDKFKVA